MDEKYSPMYNYGVTPEKWEYMNKVIWPPNYVVPETGKPKSREVFHCIESIHTPTKKMFTVCHFALNMVVDDALKQLRNHQTKPPFLLADIIEEAKTRAKKEFFIEEPGKMFVAEIFPLQCKIVKGARRHAHERWHTLKYRYINLFVRLQEGDPPKFKGREAEPNGWDKMDNYYEFLRSRDFKYSI
uniref:Large ribosomal subunit protein uL22m n=1 Tax=Globodera rostochiensis TaxID=31243 RepID=A0A914HXD9_GLORO